MSHRILFHLCPPFSHPKFAEAACGSGALGAAAFGGRGSPRTAEAAGRPGTTLAGRRRVGQRRMGHFSLEIMGKSPYGYFEWVNLKYQWIFFFSWEFMVVWDRLWDFSWDFTRNTMVHSGN